MVLQGTVSNVAQFGAFVDLGVHQDGLVHVSQISHKFVDDARDVVKTGQVVKVRVLEVDLARKRISLTMKLDAPARTGPRDGGACHLRRATSACGRLQPQPRLRARWPLPSPGSRSNVRSRLRRSRRRRPAKALCAIGLHAA